LNADMSSSFGGIPRSLERGGCHSIRLPQYSYCRGESYVDKEEAYAVILSGFDGPIENIWEKMPLLMIDFKKNIISDLMEINSNIENYNDLSPKKRSAIFNLVESRQLKIVGDTSGVIVKDLNGQDIMSIDYTKKSINFY